MSYDPQPEDKGTVVVGSGTTSQFFPVGADDEILTADSTEDLGVKWAAPVSSADGLGPDGDKGDITVGGAGTTLTVDNSAITYAKIQNVSATDKLLGRSTAGAGVVEEIACTAAGRALLDDADATAQRATLGLGTLATQSGTFSGTSSGTNTGDQTLFNQTIEEEGTPVTQRSNVNFTGAGVSVADAGGKTVVTIAGGSGEAFPVGSVFIGAVSTSPATLLGYGTWAAFGAGRVMVGLDSGDTDFDTALETGGAKTVASAGTNANEAAHTHSVTSNVSVDDHASHTHTYTQVVNHTHTVNVGSANDTSTVSGSGNIFAGTTSSVVATSANPAGGVATGTTAGPSATLTHTANNPAVTSAAGSAHTHTYTGNATSVVQPYVVCYFWRRTA